MAPGKRKAALPDPAAEATRWKRRAGERPDEILNAALEEFLARGFDAARMEDVAARAGLSKAGVYLYFDSKTALLDALIDREVKPLALRIQAMARAGHADPVNTIRALATFARGVIAEGRIFSVPRLVISIATRFPEIAQRYRREVVERALSALTALVKAGIEQGVFRAVDPAMAARSVAGPMILEALWQHLLGGETLSPDPGAVAERHLDILLKGLLKEGR